MPLPQGNTAPGVVAMGLDVELASWSKAEIKWTLFVLNELVRANPCQRAQKMEMMQ